MVPGFCRNVYKSRLTENFSPTIELLLGGIYRSLLAVPAKSLEAKNAVACGKKGIVAALAYVCARMDPCASLTDKDIARKHKLTVASLYAKTL